MAEYEEEDSNNPSILTDDTSKIMIPEDYYNLTHLVARAYLNTTYPWWIPLATTEKPKRSDLDDQFNMALWAQLTWTALFSIMLIIAIGGNAIVIWIVAAHRRMRSVTNYFLVNLSTADLLMSILNCLFNFIYMVHSDWQFGERYCTISNFIAIVSVAASVFTLTGISCDRYLAIVHPLQPRITRTMAASTIVIIWLISAVLGWPCLLYSRTIEYRFHDRIRISCILIWPDGMPHASKYDYIYQVIFFVTTYFVPMALMIWSYSAMGVVLWGSKSIGEMTQRQMDSIRSKRKVVRMFIIVVIIFGVCWLPYHVYFIYIHYDRSILYSPYVQHIYLGFYWFAMANAMVNPLIYYWMNARFRKYFKTALCCWKKLLMHKNSTSSNATGTATALYGNAVDSYGTRRIHGSVISRHVNNSSKKINHSNKDFSKKRGSRKQQVRLTHNCNVVGYGPAGLPVVGVSVAPRATTEPQSGRPDSSRELLPSGDPQTHSPISQELTMNPQPAPLTEVPAMVPMQKPDNEVTNLPQHNVVSEVGTMKHSRSV